MKLALYSGDDFTNMNLSVDNEIGHQRHVTTLFDHILSKPVTKDSFEALLRAFPNL